MPDLTKPRALDVLVVFAAGGLLCGAAEGTAGYAMFGYHVPGLIWITALLYCAVAMAVCVVGWPLWRKRLGFLFGFAVVCGFAPYAVLIKTAPRYQGYLTPKQGLWLSVSLAVIFGLACAAWYLKSYDSAMKWSRRTFAVVAVVVTVWAGVANFLLRPKQPPVSPVASAPNVVLIVVDTLRADHLSLYGYNRNTTPNLDRIAAQGVVFDNAISASSWTLPGHASLVTGLYPSVHGATHVMDSIPSNRPTLAEQFFARGYRTAAFSANTYFFGRERGFGRGFQTFGDYFPSVAAAFQHTQLGNWINQTLFDHGLMSDILGRQSAADINRAALHWVDGGHRPFFLMLNYFDVHDPYIPPAGAARVWGNDESRPKHLISESFNQFHNPTPDELRYDMDQYDNSLLYVDSQIEALMGQLQRRGLDRNMLLIVTADHGEEFDEHGILTHANALYLEEIRVPLLLWKPGTLPAGVRVSRPVSTVNVGATALDIAGSSTASAFPGRSLQAFWSNGDVNHWPYPVSELARMTVNKNFPNYLGPMQSIVTDQWHYVLGPSNRQTLYACCTSGVDQQDLSAGEQAKSVMKDLRTELEENAKPLR